MAAKKILYIITKSNWGGAQRYVYDLATNLPKDRFEIAVAAGEGGLLFEKLQNKNIRTITILGLGRDINIVKEIKSFINIFRLFIKEKPDVIHLNSSKIGALGAVAARAASLIARRRFLIVFTVHGWGFNEDRHFWTKKIIFFISWFSSLFQNKIILINRRDYQSAQKFIPQRKLALIFNGIGNQEYIMRELARAELAKKINQQINNDSLIVGTIAELTKNKGLIYLIDAVCELKSQPTRPNLKIIIIGNGEDYEALQNHIQTLGLRDTVFLAGFIKNASHYLKALDIFILPSIKEGLPYTLMEAMAAGLTVIATDVGGIPDLITHEKDGIVIPPKNKTKIAEALNTLLKDENLRLALGRNAKEKIEKDFKLSEMVKNTAAIYEKV